jgi:hypothetical protein
MLCQVQLQRPLSNHAGRRRGTAAAAHLVRWHCPRAVQDLLLQLLQPGSQRAPLLHCCCCLALALPRHQLAVLQLSLRHT